MEITFQYPKLASINDEYPDKIKVTVKNQYLQLVSRDSGLPLESKTVLLEIPKQVVV